MIALKDKTSEPIDVAIVLREKEEAIELVQQTLKWRRSRLADLDSSATPGDKLTLQLTEIAAELIEIKTESLEDERRLADGIGTLLHQANILDIVNLKIQATDLKAQINLDSDARKAYG